MFRHCYGHPFDLAHTPVFLAGVSAGNGVFMVDTELFKVSNLSAGILPLLPDKATKSPDNPGFQRLQDVSGFGQAEIIPPSSEIRIQLFDNLGQAFPTVSVGQLPDSLLEPLDGFGVNPYFRLAVHVEKCKAEKLAQPWAADRTFLFVYLESEFNS